MPYYVGFWDISPLRGLRGCGKNSFC